MLSIKQKFGPISVKSENIYPFNFLADDVVAKPLQDEKGVKGAVINSHVPIESSNHLVTKSVPSYQAK